MAGAEEVLTRRPSFCLAHRVPEGRAYWPVAYDDDGERGVVVFVFNRSDGALGLVSVGARCVDRHWQSIGESFAEWPCETLERPPATPSGIIAPFIFTEADDAAKTLALPFVATAGVLAVRATAGQTSRWVGVDQHSGAAVVILHTTAHAQTVKLEGLQAAGLGPPVVLPA